jgi:threonine/homoserine/homoserine lactone efflux protein
MDASAALIAGLVAGLAIAVQVGAVSLLLVETAVVAGPRVGVAAGLGVATVDLLFAVAAVAAGGAVGAVLSTHESEIRLVAAATLAGTALHGLVAVARERTRGDGAVARAAGGGPGALAQYVRFVAITSANPLTIASFAAVATSLSLAGPAAAAAFAVGVGAASGGWHLVLSAAAGHAGPWVTPRVQRALAVGGRLAVLGIAAHLALAG